MTISLAIDTATSRTIVAMVDGDKVLFERFHEGATDHGKAITLLVSEALQVCPNPDQVVVGMGLDHLLDYELELLLRIPSHLLARSQLLESVR